MLYPILTLFPISTLHHLHDTPIPYTAPTPHTTPTPHDTPIPYTAPNPHTTPTPHDTPIPYAAPTNHTTPIPHTLHSPTRPKIPTSKKAENLRAPIYPSVHTICLISFQPLYVISQSSTGQPRRAVFFITPQTRYTDSEVFLMFVSSSRL